MSLKRLKTFRLVVDQKSFSTVAEILGVSQPAVSKQIKSLEVDLGVILLNRETFETTEAGKLVYTKGKRLLQNWDDLVQECHSLQGQLSGLLRIGASTIPGSYLVPTLIKKFKQTFPQMDIRLFVHESEEILHLIHHGKLDIGIVGSKPSAELFTSHMITKDKLLLIGPIDSEELDERDVEIRDLPFIFRSDRSGTWQAAQQGLLEWSGVSTEDLKCVAKVHSTESVITLVEAGLGYSVVSNLAVKPATSQSRVRVIAELPVERNFFLTYLKSKEDHPAITEFVHITKEKN